MTHGKFKHKSREGAIGAVRLFKHRPSVARMSHLLSLLDLSNAFASVDHEHMDSVLTHFIEPEDHDLAMLRYREFLFTVDCPDGVLELQPHCGGLQGDTFMVFMWLSAFAPLIAKWQTSQCSLDCFLGLAFAGVLLAMQQMGVSQCTQMMWPKFFFCGMQGSTDQPQQAQPSHISQHLKSPFKIV